MGLVRFPNIYPQGPGPWSDVQLRSNTGRNSSPITGKLTTLDRGGAHYAVTMRYQNLSPAMAAALKGFLISMRGMAQRTMVRDFFQAARGSFTQSQLITSPDMDSLSGWTDNSGSQGDFSLIDGKIRALRNNFINSIFLYQSVSLTAGVPYLATGRAFKNRGDLMAARVSVSTSSDATSRPYAHSEDVQAAAFLSIPFVPDQTPLFFQWIFPIDAANSRDFHESFTLDLGALSRCALIDVPENLFIRSAEFGTGWSRLNTTVVADQEEISNHAYADEIVEGSTTGSVHYWSQTIVKSAAAELYTQSIFAKQATGDRGISLRFDDGTDVNLARAYFDLSAGTVLSVAAGGEFQLPRATITPVTVANDTGWFRVTLSAISNDETTLRNFLYLTDGATGTYNGDGSSSLFVWGAQLQRSALAGRYFETTSAIIDGESAENPGGDLFLKGLPVSSNGLFLPGDPLQIVYSPSDGNTDALTQIARVREPVNSDPYGVAWVGIEPGLRSAPDITARNVVSVSTNNPGQRIEPHVMLWRPEMLCYLENDTVQWSETAEGAVNCEFTLVEDIQE